MMGVYYYQATFQLENSSGKSYKNTYSAPGVIAYCLLVGSQTDLRVTLTRVQSQSTHLQTATISQAHTTVLSVPPGQNTATPFLGPLP